MVDKEGSISAPAKSLMEQIKHPLAIFMSSSRKQAIRLNGMDLSSLIFFLNILDKLTNSISLFF